LVFLLTFEKVLKISCITEFLIVLIMYTYKIHLHKEEEGGFTVSVPALPVCITYGEDVDTAISMAKEAIKLYIEELLDRGEVVPDDTNTLEYSLNLEVA
jgi:antitoxin HicB